MHKAPPEIARGSLLVVDDDLGFRQTLEALLIGEGYEVRCAASGGTALMFAAEEPLI
jgi:CheY-like chemotaxis protein